MKNRINWKAIFKGFAWLICLAGVVVLMSFINVKKHEVKCKKVQILIPGADNFVEIEEIGAILKQSDGELVGRNLEEINIHKIEQSIKNNPYIAFVKVYTDMDGVIYVEIKQRQPVVRILNAGGQDYYIDSKGLKMPMSSNFTANVLVATGNILEGFGGRVDTLHTSLARDLYNVALFVKKDTLWDAQIEQLYVNDKKDIELIPRVGNQRIILGNSDSLATKMNNLLVFYKQAMPKVGWNAYKTINLKYSNQIVCEKYDSLEIVKANKPIVFDSTAYKQNVEVNTVLKSAIKEELKGTNNTVAPKPVTEKVLTSKPVDKVLTNSNSANKKTTPQKAVETIKSTTVEKNKEKKVEETVKKPASTKVEIPVKPTTTNKEEKKPKTFAEKMADKMNKALKEESKKPTSKDKTNTKENNR